MKIEKITFFNYQDSTYRIYQNYYINSLFSICKRLKIKFKVVQAKTNKDFNAHVGEYEVVFSGRKKLRFAIDAHDHRDIRSEPILNKSDLYFKSNKWGNVPYPDKVIPVINGNGLINEKQKGQLISLRGQEPIYDLIFISRVWGGREHNIRIFEQIAKIPCKKKVLALFTESDKTQEATPAFMNRLEKAQIEFTYNDVDTGRLWEETARSRWVLVRAGKHLCIPWRMIDLLTLNSAVIIDSDPYPKWPTPLQEGINFYSLGINRPFDTDPAIQQEYDLIPDKIQSILGDTNLAEQISHNNKMYFEDHVDFPKVGQYIVEELEKKAAALWN
jgi:hypothetical protein